MEMSSLVTLMVPSQFGEKVTSYKNSPVHFFTIIAMKLNHLHIVKKDKLNLGLLISLDFSIKEDQVCC